MPSLATLVSLSAVVSALVDVYSAGVGTFSTYLESRRSQTTAANLSPAIAAYFSSYDDDEIKSIEDRLLACRKQFAAEGTGAQRKRCLCHVLKDVADGNNGLPPGDWQKLAEHLGCFGPDLAKQAMAEKKDEHIRKSKRE